MIVIEIEEARALVHRLMRKLDHGEAQCAIIADHMIDCELRGFAYGGLSRAVSLAEKLKASPEPRQPLRIQRSTPVSALIDGGNQAGYLTVHYATEIALQKAREHGIGIAGVFNTWMTGMFSYYMEMLTNAGLIGMAFGSSAWRVAPYASSEGRFGTNPLAFGFPTEGDPVIFDAAVSSTMIADAVMHKRLGKALPAGRAYAPDGAPTTDPDAALEGAFSVWGGHKGSGLGMVVQLFGLLCNSEVRPIPHKDCATLIVAMQPDLLIDAAVFRARAAQYADAIRAARPVEGSEAMRMPFERSLAARRRNLERGTLEVPEAVHREILAWLAPAGSG